DPARIMATLPWVPQCDSLDAIIAHALAWEEKLGALRARQRDAA
ncbi:MAG: UDP-glucose 4-epimerase GalE, partial [Alteraurantiacibacter sp.]|nr:UDP-glucose 4-epimerase GalE [Alteraurantiacibacter sp.]